MTFASMVIVVKQGVQLWDALLHKYGFNENGVVSMVTSLNPSCCHIYWLKFFIHLRSLNIHYFEWFNLQDYKLWCQGHLQWHDIHAKFHKNLPLGPKVFSGERTDRQTDSMVIL
jgi:hypothetical protein